MIICHYLKYSLHNMAKENFRTFLRLLLTSPSAIGITVKTIAFAIERRFLRNPLS